MIMYWDAVTPADAEKAQLLDPEAFWEWLLERTGRLSFDIDKAWQAVHFALTGDPWSTAGPLGQAVLGGEPFGPEVGPDQARWLPAETVRAIAGQLVALTPEQFEQRLDFPAMQRADVYPMIWDEDPEADGLIVYVRGGYEQLRDGYARAAEAGQGFVITLL
jgi:hypothetical protein